jgi:hypothetical protein
MGRRRKTRGGVAIFLLLFASNGEWCTPFFNITSSLAHTQQSDNQIDTKNNKFQETCDKVQTTWVLWGKEKSFDDG